jgi:hypothetical protein
VSGCTVREPVMVGSTLIEFRCGCGWESEAVRPELRGAFAAICAQYREHLAATGYYPSEDE